MQQGLADDGLAHVQAPAPIAEGLCVQCYYLRFLGEAHLTSHSCTIITRSATNLQAKRMPGCRMISDLVMHHQQSTREGLSCLFVCERSQQQGTRHLSTGLQVAALPQGSRTTCSRSQCNVKAKFIVGLASSGLQKGTTRIR